MEDKKLTREEFMKSYSNLPLSTREEIVVVVEGEPVTWKAAYLEIQGNTERGQKILDTLERILG